MNETPSREVSRRDFLTQAGALAGLSVLGPLDSFSTAPPRRGTRASSKKITIEHVDTNFEREPLIRPFGFKGGFLTEIWQSVALLQSTSGVRTIGLGTQNVLWSDANRRSNGSRYALRSSILKPSSIPPHPHTPTQNRNPKAKLVFSD